MTLPSDINIVGHFWGSDFGNYELESIARSLVVYFQGNGNTWKPFKVDELPNGDDHSVHWYFKVANYSFVARGFMVECDGGSYAVTDKFIEAVSKFKKKIKEV
jgi:hypothetical protein